MPRTSPIPKYRLHKARNSAVVTLDGRNIYLGKFDSPESRAEYDRVIQEWLAAGRHAPAPKSRGAATTFATSLTITEVVARYWAFAQGYYVRDGKPAQELGNIKDALRPLRRLYGETEANHFGPVALKALRQAMVDSGLARNTINSRVGKIRRMMKWAVAEELVAPTALLGLQAVAGLRPGRSGARETAPVRPVTPEQVEAVLPHVSAPVRAMIRLQDLTGARPGEIMSMRTCDVDRSGPVWIFRPARHKTMDKGFSREIPLGPRAQAVLTQWLKDDQTAYVFSPAEAVAIRHETARRNRKSPMTPSQAARVPKSAPKRQAGARYQKRMYHHAICRGCDRAFPHPTLSEIPARDLTPEQAVELKAWRKSHRWHPHQLRHAAATRIRQRYGLEGAQVALGHARARTTEIYAERDLTKAVTIALEIG